MPSNITVVYLHNGRWQLWDGPEGINGKSQTADYTEPIFWIKSENCAYYAETMYWGKERVIKIEKWQTWPHLSVDKILE